jgi:uncharacterized surface protein with fasciclin (FAS1) repeats
MRTRAFVVSAVFVASALGIAACGSSSPSSSPTTTSSSAASMPKSPAMNIVQIASSNPDLSTLVSALKAAGLVTTLEGKGPFTVFAPTNEAFAALPAGTVQTLLQPANKAELSSILTYHVVSGAYTSANLPTGAVKTVNGATVSVSQTGGQVDLTDGKGNVVHVTTANIKASNGVIHLISGVLMPPAS